MTRYAAETLCERFRVAVLTSRTNLLAPSNRVPSSVRPLNGASVAHILNQWAGMPRSLVEVTYLSADVLAYAYTSLLVRGPGGGLALARDDRQVTRALEDVAAAALACFAVKRDRHPAPSIERELAPYEGIVPSYRAASVPAVAQAARPRPCPSWQRTRGMTPLMSSPQLRRDLSRLRPSGQPSRLRLLRQRARPRAAWERPTMPTRPIAGSLPPSRARTAHALRARVAWEAG